jgi:hypothetical protein
VLWWLEESGLSLDELLELAWWIVGDSDADWLPVAA